MENYKQQYLYKKNIYYRLCSIIGGARFATITNTIGTTVHFNNMEAFIKYCHNNKTLTSVTFHSQKTTLYKPVKLFENQLFLISIVGSVTLEDDCSYMFRGASVFNWDIAHWDVSGVTNMLGMFQGAVAFNQDISSWDVQNVTNMMEMFKYAAAFNSPMKYWNVSKVTNMMEMFQGAMSFNQDISRWDVQNVAIMMRMFDGATLFNGDISGWDRSTTFRLLNMFPDTMSWLRDDGDEADDEKFDGVYDTDDDDDDEKFDGVYDTDDDDDDQYRPQTSQQVEGKIGEVPEYGEIDVGDISEERPFSQFRPQTSQQVEGKIGEVPEYGEIDVGDISEERPFSQFRPQTSQQVDDDDDEFSDDVHQIIRF